jgi:hypothetical protein
VTAAQIACCGPAVVLPGPILSLILGPRGAREDSRDLPNFLFGSVLRAEQCCDNGQGSRPVSDDFVGTEFDRR